MIPAVCFCVCCFETDRKEKLPEEFGIIGWLEIHTSQHLSDDNLRKTQGINAHRFSQLVQDKAQTHRQSSYK